MMPDEIDDAMMTTISRVQLLVADINRKIMTGVADISEIHDATLWIAELTNELDALREQLQEGATDE